jgi:hypothetical protein
MKAKHLHRLFLVAGCGSALVAHADDSLPKTLMTERGKLLVSEDLSKMPAEVSKSGGLPSLKSGWRFAPGKWEFVEDALKGTQLEADHHSAGAFFAFEYKDAVIQFDVRLDGCRQALFCVDDPAAMRPPTPTRPAELRVEHLCRVTFDKDGFATQKDDHDHDGPDKAEPFGKVPMRFEPGHWKTVLVELKGDEMVTTIDGQTIAGAHPLIASDKAYFSFNVTGDSARFRKLRIWEAVPNKDWAANKAKLTPAK